MLKLNKTQYFILFIFAFALTAAASLHDAYMSGGSLSPAIASAFFVVLGFMSKVKEEE